MRRITFDLDVLRTFATGVELGSFTKAAARLGRSTSAMSAQLKKLEEQAGTPVLAKQGRGLVLTEAGETMLAYARRLLELNDEAAQAVRGVELDGRVRIGVQEDFGEIFLPQVLARFGRAFPKIRIEARIARNLELKERISSGQLDVALIWRSQEAERLGEEIARIPLRWIGPKNRSADVCDSDQPLPLVLFEAPCFFRNAAIEALDAAGRSWRMALTSPSLAGVWAAAAAGVGVTMRTGFGLPSGLAPLEPSTTLPRDLPWISLVLHRGADPSPAADRLADIIRVVSRDGLPEGSRVGSPEGEDSLLVDPSTVEHQDRSHEV